MKVPAVPIALSVLVHCAFAVAVKSGGGSFGPKNCVKLSRSTEGTRVLSTDCEGSDLSLTEFAFDCMGQSAGEGIVRHSFGLGGFESNEEFDTEVKCARCESPASSDVVVGTHEKAAAQAAAVPAAPKPVSKATPKVEATPKVPHAAVVFKAKRRHSVKVAQQAKAAAKTEAKFWPLDGLLGKAKPEKVKYGPNGCVSTWKSAEGHCMIETDCEKSDISQYEFGLVCVDKVGSPVRHLFGKDSFDAEETFDTLIKCEKCLGLEDIPDAVALNGEVMTMAKDISNLKDVMKNISLNVQMLNNEVFKSAPGPAPAAAGPAPAAAKGLVQHATSHHRTSAHLRHSHRHHREDDDDEDDEEGESDVRCSHS